MKYKTLIFEKSEGIGTVSLNRPKFLNALNSETYEELYLLFKYIEDDPKVRVAIITGIGEKAFAAGTDISSMVSLTSKEALEFAHHLRRTCDLIYNLKK